MGELEGEIVGARVETLLEETDEPIGKKRLEKMPWTTMSIEAAERAERESKPWGA